MANSIIDRLQALTDEAGDTLIAAAARPALRAAATAFEGSGADIAVECHLDQARADLVVGLRPADRDLLLARGGLPDRVRRFLERWASPPDPLHALPFLELEFDLAGDALPEPWIGPTIESFVGPVRELTGSRRGARVETWPSFVLTLHVVDALGADAEAWRPRLIEVYRALPEVSSIHHLTVLDARPRSASSGIRLIVSLPRYAATAYLAEVGFEGDAARVDELLDRFLPSEGLVDLDLDVGLGGAANRTATYAEYTAPRRADTGLRLQLDALARRHGVSRASIAALKRWVGVCDGRLSRALSLKVGFEGDRTFAKAYLQSREAGVHSDG